MTTETEPALRGIAPASARLRPSLSMYRSLTVREVAVAWAALAFIAALAFAPHIIHGGFYSDDWSNGATALDPPGGRGFGNAISAFANSTLFRPVLVIYVPLTYFVFGLHMTPHLIWMVVLAFMVAALLYGVLRTLGTPWIHAWLLSALTLVYPWFDSTRLWVTADQISLSIVFALAGLWIALLGLSRRGWRWHACAASLYLLSILTYEITLPFIMAVGVLYVFRVGWRAARLRWATDLAVAVVGGGWVASHTVRTTAGISGDISHLGEIIHGGAGIVGRTVIPVGVERTSLALIALGTVFALGLFALLALPDRFSKRSGWGLRSWLLLGASGLAVAALGWVIFIPADPYYTPAIWGQTNRVNGVAGIGAVILVYAALGVLGTLVGQIWRRLGLVQVVITLLLAVLLGAGYVTVIRRHTGIWNSAFVSEEAALHQIEARYPRLPSGSTLFASGYPANQTLGVPILATTWDLNGMVQTRYEDGTIAAYPIVSGFELICRGDGVILDNEGELVATAPYGTARMFDLATGKSSLPRNRSDCRSVVGHYMPGPLYLSTAY